jgi:hypothetical protein
MAAFNGKWQLASVENLEAYHNAIHTPEAYREQLRKVAEGVKTNPSAYVEELTVDEAAGTVQRVVYILGEKKKDSGALALGKELEQPAADGRPAKGTIALAAADKIVLQLKGADFEATTTFVVSGDELTVTNSSGSTAATLKYKRA